MPSTSMATDTPPAAARPEDPSPTGAPEPPPRLADGIELVGEYPDSGFKEPPYIARRSDGQVIQLPKLLFQLAEHVDGRRSYEEIGDALSHAIGRGVTGDMVKMLADEQLRPLGVLAAPDGSSPPLQKADPLLALNFRTAVIPEGFTRVLTTIFRPLFLPPVVIAVVAGLLALDYWLLFEHGIAASLRAAIYNPALLLGLLGCVVLATAFHEIGHATACRYGGAKPGVMGVGIYIVWPAFYTDVTDAYRLGRGGRLRTDLGGVYFNAIFALATAGLYVATGFEPLLLVILVQNMAI
ncbi:MAG: putative peptide zinc metalloprotease protein, partial [Solirubrobacteraceae bacterium]|nr:putative peptide zinc metalloprotease protein [Solirubrobacteraceae bacterium]